MGTCCICLRSRSVRNVPKCKVDLTLCLRCFVIEIWCGIKVGVGLVIGRRLIRAQISMRNTLTAMSKTPEMSQVRLPCRQEGKTSAGNWAWTLNGGQWQKKEEKNSVFEKRFNSYGQIAKSISYDSKAHFTFIWAQSFLLPSSSEETLQA